ncbi:MAG: hypothetical protein HYZ79_08610 [Candidatus Melainabacteria bacterium]|nr:hypothetical protein [Candidatus Melainabacteria bacterium]
MPTKNISKADPKPFSEVIYSTNDFLIAQCYKNSTINNESTPNIIQGQVVKIKSSYDASYATFGIITKINNSSIDNIHRPSALGLNASELEQFQPQIYDLLRKELEIYLFAYTNDGNKVTSELPPKPMVVHDFVYQANDRELFQLTENFSNLANIIKKHSLKLNLLADLVSLGYKLRNNNYEYLVEKAQNLSITFSDEVDSLMLLLRKIKPESL